MVYTIYQGIWMLPEEIAPLPISVAPAVTMSSAGNDDELEFLVGPDQGIG